MMRDGGSADQRARVAAAADRLRIDAATSEVLRAFAAAGVQALVLKGPSLTHWLHPSDGTQSYLDSDLLLRPGDDTPAADVLTRLGFEREHDNTALPEWWREHAGTWWREQDGVRVDLHGRLLGVGVDATAAWRVFVEDEVTIPLAGFAAPTLAPPARLMHAVIHAAQHGAEWGKAIAHVQRALEVLDDELWGSAAAVAARLEATDAFAAGLRLTPEGSDLAGRLGLRANSSVQVALRAKTPPPLALGFEQLAGASSLHARASIVWHKLVPPREFIVHWYPPARNSRVQFALAYVRRPLWILSRAPQGFRAWRRTRREVRRR